MKQLIAMLFAFFLLAATSVLACEAGQAIRIDRKASQPSTPGAAEYFTGQVWIDTPFKGDAPARAYGATVTFAPGARTAWHRHPFGQILVVTKGTGLVQRSGDPVETIRLGDVVWIPPQQKHWQGAAPDTAMSHIAIVEQLDGKATEWMEQVSDAQYSASTSARNGVKEEGKEKSRAQMLFGEIAPKFAELTDEVLYADVWERPQLSKRDRSLITVAALVAMNRPAQLKSHLSLALKNGVSEEELIETITHLAFYAGWPNSVTAMMTAKEVFENPSP
jgi:4-carboxymuconolactone decarboxylase